MNAFNNFLRAETSKEEKKNLLKDARELQANRQDGAENASIGIYMTTSLEYAPKKVAKSRGFSGIAIIVVGPCKSKIELSVSTSLPEDVIVLVELKSASEARYELKLLEPSNAASLKITDCKTTVTVHTVPCRLSELIDLLVEQTTPPPSPPHQPTPLARVPVHDVSPRSRRRMQPLDSSPDHPRNRCAAALFCIAVISALCLAAAHLSVTSEPHLSRAARFESVVLGRSELFEEVIARVACGQSITRALLPPGSTIDDVLRFLMASYNQVLQDVIVLALLEPDMQGRRRSLAKKLREAHLGVFLADNGLHVFPPPVSMKDLRYVGEALPDDLDRLTALVADLVPTSGPRALYKRYAQIKELCAWFSQRWEGACKHHLSE